MATSNDLLEKIIQLLEHDVLWSENVESYFVNMFLNSGDLGINLLTLCLADAVNVRANINELLSVAIDVAKFSHNKELNDLLDNIFICKPWVQGYPPTPPQWMPTLRPEYIGGGGYGWSDHTFSNYQGWIVSRKMI